MALVVLTALAVGIALLLQRRRPDPPSAPSYRAPQQLDRDDFTNPAAPILIALFTSTTCDTCPAAWDAVQAAVGQRGEVGRDPDEIAVQRIDVQNDPALHKRYRIDGVPTTVLTDGEGVVTQAFFGPVTVRDVTEALPPL